MTDPATPAAPEPGGGALERPPAPLGRRFVAKLLDGFVVLALTYPLWSTSVEVDGDAAEAAAPGIGAIAAVLAISAVYEIVPLVLWGRTPGKRVLGLSVTDVGGDHLAWHQATIRFLLPNAVALVPPSPVGLVAVTAIYGAALAHPERRGWHDRAAGSIVVRGA